MTFTKIENLHIDTRRKIQIPKMLFFSMTKNNEVIAEKPFQNSGVTRCLWRFTRHAALLERSVEVGFSLILSIYKVVYISIKDLHARYATTHWRNLPKMQVWIGRNLK